MSLTHLSESTPTGSRATRSLTACIALLGVVVLSPSPALAAPAIGTDPNYFPIGVFSQPANAQGTTSFAGWKLRGINTLVGYEEQDINGPGSPATVSVAQWQSAAQAAGLYTIRTPNGSTAAEWAADAATAASQGLVAWAQPDEPENHGITPSSTLASYNAWKSVAGALPVFLNLDGSKVAGIQGGGPSAATYKQYMASGDLIGQDVYPVTGFGSPSTLKWVGQATAITAQMSAKPTFAFIETSNQRLFVNSFPQWNFRGVTPGEMRVEIWDSLIHGAKGIMYFPQSFNGFRYDATPFDVAQEMTRQNQLVSSVAAVLNSDATPDITRYTLGNSGLEAMVKKDANGKNYLFVLNTTEKLLTNAAVGADFPMDVTGVDVFGEGRSITGFTPDILPGLLDFADTFDPFSLHVYTFSSSAGATSSLTASAASLVSVPEPASLAVGLVGALLALRRPRRRTDTVDVHSTRGA